MSLYSDLIQRNRLVNMLVNHILQHRKKIIGLSNYLSSNNKKFNKRQKNPLSVLRQAIHRVILDITVKASRVSGARHVSGLTQKNLY